MSEEEKEAIEYIKAFQKDLYGASDKNLMAIYIDRVWNYIDKLQKENEELKKEKENYEGYKDLVEHIQYIVSRPGTKPTEDYAEILHIFTN